MVYNRKNSDVLKHVLTALLTVASRRATQRFALMVISNIVRTLEKKYSFLRYVIIEDKGYLEGGIVINVVSDIDAVETNVVGKALETLVRIVWLDLGDKGGLFFLRELKQHVGGSYVEDIKNYGVDFDLIQLEQQYLHSRREREKAVRKPGEKKSDQDASLLGYTWENVASWKYDDNSKLCTLYGKDGKVLDTLNIASIVENHVRVITESKEPDTLPSNEKMEINETDYEFLQMLYERDIDIETAVALLHISQEEFETMVNKLLKYELLQHISSDEMKLTEKGIKRLLAERDDKTVGR